MSVVRAATHQVYLPMRIFLIYPTADSYPSFAALSGPLLRLPVLRFLTSCSPIPLCRHASPAFSVGFLPALTLRASICITTAEYIFVRTDFE
jgi:hypothetical protein